MATDESYVGSFDVPAPTGQTFASLRVWTDLYPYVKELVDNTVTVGNHWHDAGRDIGKAMERINAINTGLQEVINSLVGHFEGKAGERFGDVADACTATPSASTTTSSYPTKVGDAGHDIKVFAKEFWEAHKIFHQLTEAQEDLYEAVVRKAYAVPARTRRPR